MLSLIGFGMGTGIESNLYSEKEISDRLKSAVSNGINWFDAADSYHDGYAEEILGKVLGRERYVYFFTKFSPKNGSSKYLRKSLERSLIRLRRDYIDVYQMHWPCTNVEDYEEIFGILEDCKKEGKIREVGVCNFDMHDFSKLNINLVPKIVSNQIEFSLFNSDYYRSLKDFHEKKKILSIAYGVFEGIKRKDKAQQTRSILQKLAEKYSITQFQLVINWASRKNLAILTSSRSAERTLNNINSLDINIDQNDLNEIDFFFPGRSQNVLIKNIKFNEMATSYFSYVNEIDAKENKLNLKPGPVDLARVLVSEADFKPIKLHRKKEPNGEESYYVLNGMVRYWAWRFAFPNKDFIPSYIVDFI